MALRLTYRGETTIPLEIEGLTPDWVCDKPLSDIEQFEIFHGNRRLQLREMFAVEGDPSDKKLEFVGNLSGVHWIGAHMASGLIHVRGTAGRHVGSEMSGGEIAVDGDVGSWAGGEMRGGVLRVHGNAGPLVGSAYRGSVKGMTGGTILIQGNAEDEIGLAMRRGLIAIGGSAGNMVGFSMIAGTILVFGKCGMRPGAGMRRGTIGLFGAERPQLLPTFRYASTYQPQFLRVLLRTLRQQRFAVDDSLINSNFDLYHGDLLSVGRGEILFRHIAVANQV